MKAYRFVGLCFIATSLSAAPVEIIQVTEGARTTNTYDLVLVVQQLQAEVRGLRGQVESQQYELNKLKQQQREMYTDLDSRLGGGSFMQESSPTESIANSPALSGDEQQDYSAAFAYVKSQSFAQAESAFIAYKKRHPKAQRLSNALYWLGEVCLAQGKLAQAKDYFSQLRSQFPASAKIPDAMYKLGRVLQRMDRAGAAVEIWQELVDRYPKTSAAGLAHNALR